ncbi:helix-turn-helix domain-containing protein [Sandaracinobacteroides saxicola]|uniref:Helix-turn-helix transcriptional regulator n=1 Tax=Sandaracinobacteroides saxicola TaxID=2759707 RepID=A0A7G5IE05_9SPHN|nr:AraC family transcriptional regulator [Sandaracinobacteroides saxicola]QMW21597.1 helix-turn-helix transcriptional regulator [Sandaracinobacteroides saxicola]
MNVDYTHIDWFETGQVAPFVMARQMLGPASGAAMYRCAQPAGDMSDPPAASLILARLRSSAAPGLFDLGSGRKSFTPLVNHIAITMPHQGTTYILDKAHELDALVLPVAEIDRIEPDRSGAPIDFDGLHANFVRDQIVSTLLDMVWASCDGGCENERLLQESLIASIMHRLRTLAGSHARSPVALDAQTLARIVDCIEADLAGDHSLVELSASVGMTASAFHRAFRETTGRTPHAWLLERRVERAKCLLRQTDETIANVAYDVGFSSQAHLTSTFTKRLGVSPARYRREQRS